ncbi:MAG: TolC family protein [Chitinophagaceae bacterium]|nr:TolC family protein [Chitinophagaceae bacterium]
MKTAKLLSAMRKESFKCILSAMLTGWAAFSGATMYAQQSSPPTPVKHAFSVKQAVEYALKNNASVKNALLQIKIQEEQNRAVTASAYPRISASLGTTYNPAVFTQVLPNFISPATYQVLIKEGVKDGNGNPIQMPSDFGFVSAQFGTRFSANAGVTLTQLLFDGQVFVGLQARDASMRLQQKAAEVTEEMIRVNIHKIYYQLVISRLQLELLDANIALAEKNLNDTKIIYENGFREKLDVEKETVRLANLKTEKQKLLNQIANGYYGLKLLMGMPMHEELVLTDKITDDNIREGLPVEEKYEYENRKEYQQFMVSKELLEYNVKRFRLSQVPTVSLTASYAQNAQRNRWNFLGRGDWFTVSSINLNISVPIFNGFFTRSKINEARLELDKIKNQMENLKLSIDNEVQVARNNFKNAVATMDYQKKNMELAEKIYQQTKKKYEMGLGSQIEIVAAQTELKAAQTNYITAMYDAVIARIDYLKAVGKL